MCYDVASRARIALRIAEHENEDTDAIQRLRNLVKELETHDWPRMYHASGFSFPKLPVFTNKDPLKPQFFNWGLIPYWVKDKKSADAIKKGTLNARSESIFEKPSFRNAAKSKRCLIYLDAFFEHHHLDGKTYPFRITMKDGSPLCVAGLWEEWVDREDTGEVIPTVTIVTTVGNPKMAAIHNNPKAEGSRMPVILSEDKQDEWLSDNDPEHLKTVMVPFDQDLLRYQTVGRLKGKEQLGNVPQVEDDVLYPELTWFNS